ncbi:hypothetical protein [Nocardioides sp. URHA0020]|uniref:hypothetical protein n=1 Tax=Nocardioides sp. URHA0020 TaxID=1380392 RepID=UPI00049018A4|nr:hypothetical protein [Nocardioides sp. URHA0020]
MSDFLTDDRVKVLRRLLYLTLAFAVVVALLALPGLIGDFQRYAITLLVIATTFAVSGAVALRAVRGRAESARRLCILTAVFLLVMSLPLMGVLVGLLTAITGVGLLVVIFAPERDPS